MTDTIKALLAKGVEIPNPQSLEVGEEVVVDQISGKDVTLHPGCRIRGRTTVISAGCSLGDEAPVTLMDCQLARNVALKGGYFDNALFLDGANMGSGAHVRAATILEEEANGAHTVGFKHTILLPFVTVGSLINFCDCLMAGGTSRKDHSEVGSSYIHFNFTPDGHKATASLIGDVPRGVMLNQPRIFLGGQGGLVGPVRLGFGNVIAAGTVYRQDCLEDGKLLITQPPKQKTVDYVSRLYPNLERLVENNFRYLGNLHALEQWYSRARRPFLSKAEFGDQLMDGALAKLKLAKAERRKRLAALLGHLGAESADAGSASLRRTLFERRDELVETLVSDRLVEVGQKERDRFLESLQSAGDRADGNYVAAIQGLDPSVTAVGTQWLQAIVDETCRQAWRVLR